MHSLYYRGYQVHCDGYMYWIGLNPTIKYLTFEDCKNEIDRLLKNPYA